MSTPSREIWLCEGCGVAYVGVSPPDKCDVCDHEFFENIADMEEEQKHVALH